MLDATNPQRTSRRRYDSFTRPDPDWPTAQALRCEIRRLQRLPRNSPCKALADDLEWNHMRSAMIAHRYDQLYDLLQTQGDPT